MDSVWSVALLADELGNFSIFGVNMTEKLIWFLLVYAFFVLWDLLGVVHQHCGADVHHLDTSIYFSHLATVLTNSVIQPKTIRVVDSVHLVDEAVAQLLRRIINFPVLGMDCEMKCRAGLSPTVHLLQFATQDGYCVLFRTSFLPRIPASLSGLLSNSNIWKVGIGVYNDALYLLNQYPNQFQIKGTFDIRYLAHYFGFPERGLKKLSCRLLHAAENECVNGEGEWDDIELMPERIMYAATDALLGILLFLSFFHMHVKEKYRQSKSSLHEEYNPRMLTLFKQKWGHKTSKQFRDDYE